MYLKFHLWQLTIIGFSSQSNCYSKLYLCKQYLRTKLYLLLPLVCPVYRCSIIQCDATETDD